MRSSGWPFSIAHLMTLRSLLIRGLTRKEANLYRKRHAGKNRTPSAPKGVRASPNEAVRSSFCGALRMLTLWLASNMNMKWLTPSFDPFVGRQPQIPPPQTPGV